MTALSRLVAYVDESSTKRGNGTQEYLVCATIIDVDAAERIREKLSSLRLPGQVKLHWTAESDKRRRRIIAVIAGLEVAQVLIAHRSETAPRTERYRRKCLEQLYFELQQMEILDVILESRRPGQNTKDLEHIVALQNRGQATGIRLSHVRGGEEPLLWIPDAVLGAFNTRFFGQDEFWSAVCDCVTVLRSTPDSL
ncbi:MAG: hypothetical protein L0K73_12820 [Corynebacterium variabile]|uniref:hypothetical protein n=1 Tax=Corynebacterium variabile TaxID=1727 RepID=UPI002649E2DC|nr:hypothetical protein [Corynebacterium variabile]MDN6537667.1 hypothetical protein [Corynebacterium variabile]